MPSTASSAFSSSRSSRISFSSVASGKRWSRDSMPASAASSATCARTFRASALPSMMVAPTSRSVVAAIQFGCCIEYPPVPMATQEQERGPRLAAAESGSLVLADISGYTSYLLGTELEHAQDVLSDLMAVVVGRLQPPLQVSKLEGDAIFAYALDGACGASTLLDTIEQSYFAFRSRQRDIAQATSCTCAACRQIPTLDLKFLVHHGAFVRRSLAGNEELTGRDVIVIHRLSKNSAAVVLGTKGYALLSEASTTALGLDPEALGLRAHAETYDDVGEVRCYLDDLGERWQAELERRRVYVPREEATFERSLTLPVDVLVGWEWLTL